MYLQGISSLIQSKIPPPLAVRSNLNGFEKPSIKNCVSGTVSWIMVGYDSGGGIVN